MTADSGQDSIPHINRSGGTDLNASGDITVGGDAIGRDKIESHTTTNTVTVIGSGESHYFQGRRYRLNVLYHDGPPKVAIRNKTRLDLVVRTGSDTSRRERVLLLWYRRQLKALIPPLIAKCEALLDVTVAEWGVKQMKTRWGTCNIQAGRIWLNLELIKKPVSCLEYVVVHEMVHLLERRHNDRFAALMDQAMPQWRLHREELNHFSLGHEDWEY